MKNSLRAQKRVTKQQLIDALAAIEDSMGEDFMTELGMSKRLRGRLKNANSILSKIYRISHGWNPNHSCFHAHTEWREEVPHA